MRHDKRVEELSEKELEYLYRRICSEHEGKDLLCSKIAVVRSYFGDTVPTEELADILRGPSRDDRVASGD